MNDHFIPIGSGFTFYAKIVKEGKTGPWVLYNMVTPYTLRTHKPWTNLRSVNEGGQLVDLLTLLQTLEEY